MELTPSEEQRMIVDAVTGVATRLASRAGAWDATGVIDADAFEALSELGLGGLFLDAPLEGAELGVATGLLALEALARGSGALGLRLAGHAAGAVPLLSAAGLSSEALGPLVEGRRWATRVDALEVRGAGEGRALWGEARWVVGGLAADPLAVTSREGEVFLVEGALPGLTREPAPSLGMRGAGLAHVRFEGVKVGAPVAWLDAPTASRLASMKRAATAAVGVGIGRAALDEARRYARERKQFGRPIGDFQAIQWMIADAATEVDAAGLLGLRAGLTLDAGEDADAEARAALILTAEATLSAAQKAIQIHGGYGFVREFPVERLARDARYFGMAHGGRDVHRERLGRALLEA